MFRTVLYRYIYIYVYICDWARFVTVYWRARNNREGILHTRLQQMGNKNTITIYIKKEPCKRTKLATEGGGKKR